MDTSGWFMGKKQIGPKQSPPIFHSFSNFSRFLQSSVAVHRDSSTTLAIELAIAFGAKDNPSSSSTHQPVPPQMPHMAYQSADSALFKP
jgi:hypothetical protein